MKVENIEYNSPAAFVLGDEIIAKIYELENSHDDLNIESHNPIIAKIHDQTVNIDGSPIEIPVGSSDDGSDQKFIYLELVWIFFYMLNKKCKEREIKLAVKAQEILAEIDRYSHQVELKQLKPLKQLVAVIIDGAEIQGATVTVEISLKTTYAIIDELFDRIDDSIDFEKMIYRNF
jgi:hypothetical protein